MRLEQRLHGSLLLARERRQIDLTVASDMSTGPAETRQSSDSFHMKF